MQIAPIKIMCPICGTVDWYDILMSAFIAAREPDLDLRPPEMLRSSMSMWAHECKKCSYVISQSKNPFVDPVFLNSEKYIDCDGVALRSDLAKRFFREYLIALEVNDKEKAAYAIRNAAWVCDDNGDGLNAIECRKRLCNILPDVIKASRRFPKMLKREDRKKTENLILLYADALRRSEQDAKLYALCKKILFGSKRLGEALLYQAELAKTNDRSCHTFDDLRESEDSKQ